MKNTENKKEIFTPEMTEKMREVFGKMEKKLMLKLSLDNRDVSRELESYVSAMTELTDKLVLHIADKNAASDAAPCVEICLEDGTSTGIAFHGVPAEHELDSFITGLYNAAGPGQPIDEGLKKRISSIKTPLDIMVLVTLSCPMCPDLVVAAQQIAAKNSGVTAHVYDIRHFDKLRNKYNVMSVPCLVINEDRTAFGRKNLRELLDFIEK